MTLEEKARKYDDALANARQEYNTTENVERKQFLEEIFHELAESEDERIRKVLLDACLLSYSDFWEKRGVKKEGIIAWLEKQGEQKSNWSEKDERIYQSIMDDTVQENQLDGKQIDWLKSLKERIRE